MPYDPLNYDPAARVRQRLTGLQAYAQDPFSDSVMRRMQSPKVKEPQFQLGEEEREGWLKSIQNKTLGTLAGFANVLDLPGSSVRDVIAGENPFDQWKPTNWTTSDNRTTGRDLGRKWGWMKDEDTWGNLAGGIGIEMLTDPLLLLGLGGSARTAAGRFADASGLMRYKDLAIKNLQKTTPNIGKREAMRHLKIKDFLDALPEGPIGAAARQDAMDAVQRFGFRDLDDMLAKIGDEGMQGVARYGLPRIKAFGHDLTQQLADSPGILIGRPDQKWAQQYGRMWDKIGGGIFDNRGVGYVAGKVGGMFNPANENTTMPWIQSVARAYRPLRERGYELARQAGGEVQTLFETVFKDAPWNPLTYADDPIKAQKAHAMMREMAESIGTAEQKLLAAGARPEEIATLRSAMAGLTQTISQAFDSAVKAGANIGQFDDVFIDYFPRQLSSWLQTADPNSIRKFMAGNIADAGQPSMLKRMNLLRDVKGGAAGLDQVITDKNIHAILDDVSIPMKDRIKAAADYMKTTYGRGSANEIFAFGKDGGLRRTGKVVKPSEDLLKKVDAIAQDAAYTPAQRKDIIRQLLENENLTPGGKWLRGDEIGITKNTPLYKLANDRYKQMAVYIQKLSPEARQGGLFANWAIYDAEQYIGRTLDSALRANATVDMLSNSVVFAAKGQAGKPLRELLSELHIKTTPNLMEEVGDKVVKTFDPDAALRKIGENLGLVDDTMDAKQVNAALRQLGSRRVGDEYVRDILRHHQMFEGTEAGNWVARVMDSFMAGFKGNVTSPFPGFHNRNLMSGQFRNAVAGMFSFRSLRDQYKLMTGGKIEGLEKLPVIKMRYDKMRQVHPNLPTELNNEMANEMLRYMARETGVAGKWTKTGGAIDVQNIANHPSAAMLSEPMEGTAAGMRLGATGAEPFSWKHAFRSYFGRPQDAMVPTLDQATGEVVMRPGKVADTTLKRPFGIPLSPMWYAKRMFGKTDEPFWQMPSVLRQSGAYEGMGITGSRDMMAKNLFGPSRGGAEVGHAVEHANRVAPWLKLIYEGVDPGVAAARVNAAQIAYGARNFTRFEQQWLKRLFPFYSFTSRSMPYALRQFIERPGNLLSQVIRSTHRAGEHQRAQMKHPGPVPEWIGDTLAIPLESPTPGSKRFLTGMDVMDQDLWELGIPLLRAMTGQEELGKVASNVLSRGAPMWVKFPVEAATGTSLWQRGVESGRPLVNMDPQLARIVSNVQEYLQAKADGREIDPQEWKRLSKPGIVEQLVAASPYSRYIGTLRQLTDLRKGPGTKAWNLLTGSRVTDISLRAQEEVLRDNLQSMIRDAGGVVFQKATFTKDELDKLKRTDPAQWLQAMQLKALADERSEVAKKIRELSKKGLPVSGALE